MPDFQLLHCYIARLFKVKKQFNNLTIKQFKLGFTFIELLVVISIIAILVTAVIATFSGAQLKARDTRRKEDFDAFKKALELRKGDTTGGRYYPNCDVGPNCSLTAATVFNPDLDVTYLKKFPRDPKFAGTNDYIYVPIAISCISATECSDYSIVGCLENDRELDYIGALTVGPKPGAGVGSACPGAKVLSVVAP